MNDEGELQVRLLTCHKADSTSNNYVFAPETIIEYIKPTSTTEKAKAIHRLLYCIAPKPACGSTIKQYCLYDAYDPEFKMVLPMAPDPKYKGAPSTEHGKDLAFPSLDHLTCFVGNNEIHLAFVTRGQISEKSDGYHSFDYDGFSGALYAVRLKTIFNAHQTKKTLNRG